VRRSLIVAMLVLLALPGTAAAGARLPVVGFGEQRSSVFTDPHWQELGLRHMRLVVGWDFRRSRWQRREVDSWLEAARAAGAHPLVAFSRSRSHWRTQKIPSPAEYRREFRAFRTRYPWVTDFLTWNEANHCSQPLCHKPKVAARLFDVLASSCPECRIVAADVLDTDDMPKWLRTFRRAARHRPRIWGIHNYLDANRFRTSGTKAMLRTVKGEIWFTETGGLVKRTSQGTTRNHFPDSPSHAAKATRWVLGTLANLSPRVKRIYLYHFQNQGPQATWDSGILDPNGRPRPAFKVVQQWAVRAAKARARAAHGG
jgi:hypothetical protein